MRLAHRIENAPMRRVRESRTVKDLNELYEVLSSSLSESEIIDTGDILVSFTFGQELDGDTIDFYFSDRTSNKVNTVVLNVGYNLKKNRTSTQVFDSDLKRILVNVNNREVMIDFKFAKSGSTFTFLR